LKSTFLSSLLSSRTPVPCKLPNVVDISHPIFLWCSAKWEILLSPLTCQYVLRFSLKISYWYPYPSQIFFSESCHGFLVFHCSCLWWTFSNLYLHTKMPLLKLHIHLSPSLLGELSYYRLRSPETNETVRCMKWTTPWKEGKERRLREKEMFQHGGDLVKSQPNQWDVPEQFLPRRVLHWLRITWFFDSYFAYSLNGAIWEKYDSSSGRAWRKDSWMLSADGIP
jgi:hypothetical protein